MIDRTGLGALPPARRAEVIYAQARAELDRQLWRAALGEPDSRPADPLATPKVTLESMIAQWTGQVDAASPASSDPSVASEDLVSAISRHTSGSRAPRDIALDSAPRPSPGYAASSIDPAAPISNTGLGANARHAATLENAAERTGIPAPALAAIVDAEAAKGSDGSWNTHSRNPRSSAAGLGQFLSRTWQGLAEARGTWLNGVARDNGWLDGNGRVRAEARGQVLALRYDSVASINGVADFARRNLDGLRRAGVEASGDVNETARLAYLGHHLGLGDAVHFLRDRGLSGGRARVLLDAQVGHSSSAQRIAATSGDATAAHRDWLLGYLDRKIRPGRFAANA